MSDPFEDAAKRAAREIEKKASDANNPNTPSKIQQRFALAKQKREAAQRPDPPHPWPKKFYAP